MRLYHSPIGLYPFQVDDIAKGYVKPSGIVCWDTGTGKSHWAMATAALLVEDDEIDAVLLCAEKNKVSEWVEDFEKFTDLSAHKYHGTGRLKRLEKEPEPPRVIVTTYETAKADLVRMVAKPNSRGKTAEPGALAPWFEGKRVLVIYDELTKLKNRSSDNYKSHYTFVNRVLRKVYPTTRVWGLTATPLEANWEDAFSQARLVASWSMPTVKEFEDRYVKSRDPYGRPRFHDDRMPEFAERFQGIILRRRKTDPELIEQFPKMVEEARHFEMPDAQRKFYEMIEEIGWPLDQDEPEPGLFMALRQIAGHPASLLLSQGRFAQIISEELGADYLKSIPSIKTEGMLEYLAPVLGQGSKAVVFTFFGQSVLPLLQQSMETKRIQVFTNHGAMTENDQHLSRTRFRKHEGPAVLLTSDAGARGINLPEAHYLLEYESALTFANRTQRINRIHRIDSTAPSTNAMTFFLDGTVEESLAMNMSRRNADSDTLLGDEDSGEHFMSAEERRAALRIATTRRKPRRGKSA